MIKEPLYRIIDNKKMDTLKSVVIPLNRKSPASEWMNERNNSNTAERSGEEYGKYDAILSFLSGKKFK